MTETTDTTVNYPSSPPALLQIATCLGVVAGIYCISARDDGESDVWEGSDVSRSEREGFRRESARPVVQAYVRPLAVAALPREEKTSLAETAEKGAEDKALRRETAGGGALRPRSPFVLPR